MSSQVSMEDLVETCAPSTDHEEMSAEAERVFSLQKMWLSGTLKDYLKDLIKILYSLSRVDV